MHNVAVVTGLMSGNGPFLVDNRYFDIHHLLEAPSHGEPDDACADYADAWCCHVLSSPCPDLTCEPPSGAGPHIDDRLLLNTDHGGLNAWVDSLTIMARRAPLGVHNVPQILRTNVTQYGGQCPIVSGTLSDFAPVECLCTNPLKPLVPDISPAPQGVCRSGRPFMVSGSDPNRREQSELDQRDVLEVVVSTTTRQGKRARRVRILVCYAGTAAVLACGLTIFAVSDPSTLETLPASASSAPSSPPITVCANASLLTGPSSAPSGAVSVPAGDNTAQFSGALAANTTYWLAPGTHTLGSGEFAQIDAASNDTFIGGSGAILNGQNQNDFAIAGSGTNVTIEYLTIENFTAPESQAAVNQGLSSGVGGRELDHRETTPTAPA